MLKPTIENMLLFKEAHHSVKLEYPDMPSIEEMFKKMFGFDIPKEDEKDATNSRRHI